MTPSPPPRTNRRRRWFIPMYAKVLLLFFLNILVVAGGLFWLLRSTYDLDRHLLLDRAARERVMRLGETVRKEIQTKPRETWSATLQQLGTDHQITLALYGRENLLLAGSKLELPPPILEMLPKGERRPRPGPGPARFDEDDPQDPQPGPRPNPPANGADRAGPIRGVEALEAGGAYWIVLRLPPTPPQGPPDRPGPVLVGRIGALGESALLFNPKPWYFAGLGALLVSALLWFPLVRNLTNTLGQMKHATAQIAGGNFNIRVNEQRHDELGDLGASINAMSERLSGFVHGQKRFLGDIAHELCSPLARMEMALGILEQKVPDDLQSRLGDVREEVREMSELVSELLSFAKAGFDGVNTLREVVSLGSVVQSAIAREAPGADVRVDLLELTEVVAVPSLLGRALGNLLRNAVRYAGSCGAIEINAHCTGDVVEISVADQGPGVPEEDLPKLFDPFFRSDPSRTRETGGVGLGLAIVKACVDACGGSVTAANQPGGGLVVTLSLQAALDPRSSDDA